jgi:hypothetical protein
MAFTEYGLSTAASAGTLNNIENEFQSILNTPRHYAPVATLPPPGSVTRITLDQKAHHNGTVIVQWRWSVLPYAAFAHLVNTYLGGFTVDSAAVSIRTRNEQDSYSNYNAVMIRPLPGQDYKRGKGGAILDLTITFRNLVAY